MNDDSWVKLIKWLRWLIIANMIWAIARSLPRLLLEPKVLLHTVVSVWIGGKVCSFLMKRLIETDNRFIVIIMPGLVIVLALIMWLTGRWLGIY